MGKYKKGFKSYWSSFWMFRRGSGSISGLISGFLISVNRLEHAWYLYELVAQNTVRTYRVISIW